MLRRRHRTGPYLLAEARNPIRAALPVIAAAVVLLLLLWAGKAFLDSIEFGKSIQRIAVTLHSDERGSVSVSLSGQDPRMSSSELKLYPGDTVSTDRGVPATLDLFDGTVLRIDRGSTVTIEESILSPQESAYALHLNHGMAWIRTPEAIAFSGSIVRTIVTGTYESTLPSGTEASLSDSLIEVYSADGVGMTFTLPQITKPLIVGEGQRFRIPGNGVRTEEEAYAGRSALAPDVAASAFVAESRTLLGKHAAEANDAFAGASAETLTIVTPEDGSTIVTATVHVQGSYGATVDAVRVNGYRAQLDKESGEYRIELSIADVSEIPITVEALDEAGLVLEKEMITIKRDRTPPGKPTVTFPAGDRSVFKTDNEEIEIRGTAPRGTAGIIVNDYRLQLFQAGSTHWSYLASTKLQNFALGENIYRIVAVNDAGYRSDPAMLTIILGEGDEGVVSGGSSSDRSSPVGTLPDNAPLKPGTLTVTAPTAGTRHEAKLTGTGAEFLIEGNVSAGTHSVYVNDYKLQLFATGKTFFNYIASTSLNTLKRGENRYEIVARDREDKILDRTTYTIVLTVH